MHDVIDVPTDFARAYVFDMDGTIYLGEHLLPGARRMIEELRRREIPVRFCRTTRLKTRTSTSTSSRDWVCPRPSRTSPIRS